MSDWIHCNSCLARPSQNINLSVTKCGHVFCGRCLQIMLDNGAICKICNSHCTAIPLRKDTDANVLKYFTPFEELNKNSMEVYKYQLQQRNMLLKAIGRKYNENLKELKNWQEKYKKLDSEFRMVKRMLQHHGENPALFLTSTPKSSTLGSVRHYGHNSNNSTSSPAPSSIPNRTTPMYPGHAHRNMQRIFGSSSTGSPAQHVPQFRQQPRVHEPQVPRSSPAYSLGHLLKDVRLK